MTHTSVFSASQKLPVFFTSKTIQKRTKSSMRLRWSIVALVLTMKCNNTNAFVLRSILPYFNFLTFLTLVYAYVLFRAISSMNHFKKNIFVTRYWAIRNIFSDFLFEQACWRWVLILEFTQIYGKNMMIRQTTQWYWACWISKLRTMRSVIIHIIAQNLCFSKNVINKQIYD